MSRQWIREQATAQQDTAVLRQVNAMENHDSSICGRPIDCLLKLSELLSRYHGAIYRPESDSAIEKVFTAYDDYRNYDWLAGFLSSAYPLEKDLFETNLNTLKEVRIPVYLFLGRHDHMVPPEIAETFLRKLDCPKKEIIWFEQSGHEPLEEEAERFNQMIIKKAGVP